MVDTSIKSRPYRDGDEEGINDLFNRVFGKNRTIEQWRWKYIENPAVGDPSQWIMLLDRGGEIVGHYASMPVDMICGGEVVKACQPVDTMIDPGAKVGIKMLRDMFREGVALAAQEARFGFGFPNEVAYKVGKKLLGYKDLGRMEQFWRRLSLKGAVKRRMPRLPGSLVNSAHRLSKAFYSATLSTGGHTIEEAGGFGEATLPALDRLWDEVKETLRISAIRNGRYLHWRYSDRGYIILTARDGEDVTGYVVLKMSDSGEEKVGFVIDFLSKEETAEFLLKSALRYFVERDAEFCLCAVVPGSPMAPYLEEAGFEGGKGFDSFPIVYVGRSSEEENDFQMNLSNWHLTYGDTDGF